jgi:hypothetical protein
VFSLQKLYRRGQRNAATRLERAFGPLVRSSDIFIVGFPKSGLTWMSFLLAHALLEKRGGDRVNFRNIDRYVPDLSHLGTGDPLFLARYWRRPAPRAFFTHSPFEPRITAASIIYLLRDPRDVMVSYYHYHRRHMAGFDLSLGEFLRQETYFPCTWDAHVDSWLRPEREGTRIHVVRYEELRRDTPGLLRGVLDFVQAAYADEDVRRAVELADFRRMQDLEKRLPPEVTIHDQRELFVRKGKVGGWKEELAPADLELIYRRYGGAMRWFGYEVPAVGPSELDGKPECAASAESSR